MASAQMRLKDSAPPSLGATVKRRSRCDAAVRLPAALLDRTRRARVGVEVGAGRDFSTSLALAAAAPEAAWWVTDVDPRVLDAPAPLRSRIVDVTAPPAFDPAPDLVLAVRLPEELQVPAWRWARALDADLAVRALKDEWADVPGAQVWGEGWRFVPSMRRREGFRGGAAASGR